MTPCSTLMANVGARVIAECQRAEPSGALPRPGIARRVWDAMERTRAEEAEAMLAAGDRERAEVNTPWNTPR